MSVTLLIAASLMAQQMQLPPPERPVTESVDVRYARAQLQLAEANLKRVEQSNKQFERTVPDSTVAEYREDVRVAKVRLQQAAAGRSANGFQVWLQRAEAERNSAELAWKSATAANQSAAGTFTPLDVERLRLRADVAKLQLERGQSLVNAGREDQLQWQSDLLDNQVQRLKEESRDGMPYIGWDPRLWW